MWFLPTVVGGGPQFLSHILINTSFKSPQIKILHQRARSSPLPATPCSDGSIRLFLAQRQLHLASLAGPSLPWHAKGVGLWQHLRVQRQRVGRPPKAIGGTENCGAVQWKHRLARQTSRNATHVPRSAPVKIRPNLITLVGLKEHEKPRPGCTSNVDHPCKNFGSCSAVKAKPSGR